MPYYQYCLDQGIFSQRTYGIDSLTRTATRFDMVYILDNAIPEEEMEPINHLSDGFIPELDEDDTFGSVVYKWYRAGALSGDEEHRFQGHSSITRAEVSVILCQLTGLIDRVELVSTPSYEDFNLTLSSDTVEVGDTTRARMTFPENSSDHSVTWSSSNSSVAAIDNSGRITAYQAGETKITASTNGYTFFTWLTVEAAEVEVDNSAGTYAEAVLLLVNEERSKAGLHALVLDKNTQTAAEVRAKELQENCSHTRPDGRSCFTALAEAGADYRAAGENIARGYTSPADVVNAWMNSDGHRANILKQSYTAMGLGWSEGNYWAQMFIG